MDSAYLHDDTECFCFECGNNSLNAEHEMCEKCYDDNNLRYFCYYCNNYYNYLEINNICNIYIQSANKIKKQFLIFKNGKVQIKRN